VLAVSSEVYQTPQQIHLQATKCTPSKCREVIWLKTNAIVHEMLCQGSRAMQLCMRCCARDRNGQHTKLLPICTHRSVQQSLETGVELTMPATCCLCFCQGLCQFRMTHQICAAVMLYSCRQKSAYSNGTASAETSE